MRKSKEIAKILSAAVHELRNGPIDTFCYSEEEILEYANKLEKLSVQLGNGFNPILFPLLWIKLRILKLDFLPTCKWDDMTTGENAMHIANNLDELI